MPLPSPSSDASAPVRGNDVSPSGGPAGPRSAGWLVRALALPIRAYRFLISPMLPPSCRFYPSCSEYALEALSRHGALRGGLLAAGRICRCHPWNPGGVDPVPESPSPLRVRAGRWPAALRGEPPVKAD
jgi:hypothetical protein